MANGYAVKVNNEILLKTVGPTRRSAMVNWLFIPEGGNVQVTNRHGDAEIEFMFMTWRKHKRADGVEIALIQVEVREK